MKETNIIKQNKNALASFGATLLISFLIYQLGGRLFGSEYIFTQHDMTSQYIPFIKSFWNAVFGKEELDYIWGLGLGIPSWPIYVCYVLSPFNILFFLIPDSNIAAILVVFFKYALAAGCFQIFCHKVLNNNKNYTIALSVAYALCGYSIAFYHNILYADGLYMLPVILIALYHLVRYGKAKHLVLSYAYIFIVCFYSGYMIGFFSLLIFVLSLCFYVPVNKVKELVIKYLLSGISAVLLSAFALYPTVQFILSHAASDETGYTSIWTNPLKLYGNLFLGQFESYDETVPMVYCSVLILVLFVLFWKNKLIDSKVKKMIGICLGFLLLCTYLKPFYLFIHMFNVPDFYNFRFSYFYSFVFLVMFLLVLENQSKIKRKTAVLIVLVNIILYSLLFFLEKDANSELLQSKSLLNGLINLGFVVAYIWIYNKKKFAILSMVMVLEVLLNGVLMVRQFPSNDGFNKAIVASHNQEWEHALEQVVDTDLYRGMNLNPMFENESFSKGLMGVSYFDTIEQPKTRELLHKLGLFGTNRVVSDEGMTDATSMLLAIRYRFDVDYPGVSYSHGDTKVYENEMVLPLAFAANDAVLGTSLNEENPFENQNKLFSALCGQDEPLYSLFTEIEVESEGLHIEASENGGMLLSKEQGYSNGILKYSTKDSNQKLLTWISVPREGFETTGFYTVSEEDYVSAGGIRRLSTSHIMEMKLDENGVKSLYIVANENTRDIDEIEKVYFYEENEEILGAIFNDLNTSSAYDIHREGSKLEFEINIQEDKNILLTTISYDKGWHMLVDGEEQEIVPILEDTFCGIQLTTGTHQITLYYDSVHNWIGIAISIFGIVFFALLNYFDKR